MLKRRRFKQLLSLSERIDQEAARLRAEAAAMQHGPDRKALLRKVGQLEMASHIDEWLSSPGLAAPQ